MRIYSRVGKTSASENNASSVKNGTYGCRSQSNMNRKERKDAKLFLESLGDLGIFAVKIPSAARTSGRMPRYAAPSTEFFSPHQMYCPSSYTLAGSVCQE